ncbi:hypothetical protein TRFO_12832 [Tritrichomonas foetus]|uniref:Uncharacterized protein n=1 Tax=Tritrichomonas foetus TaxID=1144522 RepID=A0A1J4L0B2_9EUKA|nr:hypothetical protein TRFO_12832 [Tritrichomonas foetus]|eukprot:OHT16943.1 hypothetical protein TRFO_12832 [Tritrichomonas foetus]
MNQFQDLKRVEIQDDIAAKENSIFADDTSICRIVSTFLVFVLYFLVIIIVSFFGPNHLEKIESNLNFPKNDENTQLDLFSSTISQLSSLNQKLRISAFYPNLTSLEDKTKDLLLNLTLSFYSQHRKIDKLTSAFSIEPDQQAPLFHTSLIDFDRLEFNASIHSSFTESHNLSLTYEFVPADATFFQMKIRIVLSAVSLAVLIYSLVSGVKQKSIAQLFTIFLHVAAIFYFNPFHAFYYYYPSQFVIVIDYVFRNFGLTYFYFYCQVIFQLLASDGKINKISLSIQVFISIIFFIYCIYNGLNDVIISDPTFLPPDHYVKTLKSFFSEALFFVPVAVSIIASIFSIGENYLQRVVIFATSIALVCFAYGDFVLMNVLNGFLKNTATEWAISRAAVSVLALMMEFWGSEDGGESVEGSVSASYTNADNMMPDEDNALGLEEDEAQIPKQASKA